MSASRTAPESAPGAFDDGRPPPVGFAFDRHTWKEISHLLINLPTALIGFVYVAFTVSVGALLSVTVIGLPALSLGLAGARLIGRSERGRARALLGVRIDEPSPLHGPRRSGPDGGRNGAGGRGGAGGRLDGGFPRLWRSLKDPVAWRTVLYSFIRLPWGLLTFAIVLVSLFVLWPVLPFIARGLANADRAMVRGLLSPSDELERRIAELESDRGVVIDTAAAD
ncbi:sensor domain-containing protein, partial [Streptomyces jumonjinensis]